MLLGQRKTAERVGRYRQIEALEESVEDQVQYDRAWTRKRFSEIALLILESGADEIIRGDVIGILQPRFRDRGAATEEQAAIDAGTFLDRQELRSGLLVSRRPLQLPLRPFDVSGVSCGVESGDSKPR